MCGAKAVPQAVGVQPSVHVVMGDPLLSRATELYREGLIEAGVEGAAGAVPPPLRPFGRTSFHVVVAGL